MRKNEFVLQVEFKTVLNRRFHSTIYRTTETMAGCFANERRVWNSIQMFGKHNIVFGWMMHIEEKQM